MKSIEKKHLKRFAIVITSIFGVLFGSSFGAGVFLVEKNFGKKNPKFASDSPEFEGLPAVKLGQEEQYYLMKDANSECYMWLKESSEVVSIQSFDGLKLNAYYKKQSGSENSVNKKTAIFVHGHKAEPREMSYYAKRFFEEGFDILVIGMRGHSWSEGDIIDFGYNSSKDVKSWCEYITKINPESKIVVMGVSMGAATTMIACGNGLPENVICAIEDCGYSSLPKEVASVMKTGFKLRKFPVYYFATFYNKLKNGFWFSDVQPEKSLKNSKVPMLFIHGDKDTYVPFWMLEENFSAFSGEKEKLVMEGAIHACNPILNPEKYWNAVDSFLVKYFE